MKTEFQINHPFYTYHSSNKTRGMKTSTKYRIAMWSILTILILTTLIYVGQL